jgi:GntR family transcriptional regulator
MKAYQSIFNKISQQIISGKIAQGQKIPTEEQLCELFSVSRITVRQALKMLEDKGLIVRFPGRGSFVRMAKQQKVVIRNNDYAGSISRSVPNIKRELLTFREIIAPKYIVEKLQIPDNENCIFAQRMDMQGSVSIAFDRVYIPVTYASRVSKKIFEKVDFLTLWLAQESLEFSHATELIEAMAAGVEVSRRLKMPLRSPVLLATDIIYGIGNKPLALFESFYNGKYIKIASVAASSNCLQNQNNTAKESFSGI